MKRSMEKTKKKRNVFAVASDNRRLRQLCVDCFYSLCRFLNAKPLGLGSWVLALILQLTEQSTEWKKMKNDFYSYTTIVITILYIIKYQFEIHKGFYSESIHFFIMIGLGILFSKLCLK